MRDQINNQKEADADETCAGFFVADFAPAGLISQVIIGAGHIYFLGVAVLS